MERAQTAPWIRSSCSIPRRAALWCSNAANHAEAAAFLALPAYLNQPAAVLARALSGEIAQAPGHTVPVAEFFVPQAHGANLPNRADALWYYSQMVRWGDVEHSDAGVAIAAQSYRPDLYLSALGAEDATDAQARRSSWYDGEPYHPDTLGNYIAKLRATDLHIL